MKIRMAKFWNRNYCFFYSWQLRKNTENGAAVMSLRTFVRNVCSIKFRSKHSSNTVLCLSTMKFNGTDVSNEFSKVTKTENCKNELGLKLHK